MPKRIGGDGWSGTWLGIDIANSTKNVSKDSINQVLARTVVDAQNNHPWKDRTGNLRQSHYWLPAIEIGDSYYGQWGASAFYSYMLEFGTVNMPPYTWLRPAADRNYGNLLPTLQKNFKQNNIVDTGLPTFNISFVRTRLYRTAKTLGDLSAIGVPGLSGIRGKLYTSARILGDMQAILGGPRGIRKRATRRIAGRQAQIGQRRATRGTSGPGGRVVRRIVGRATGRGMGKFLK